MILGRQGRGEILQAAQGPLTLLLTAMRDGAYGEGILFRQRKYKDFYF